MSIPDTIPLWCPLAPGIHPDWQRWERDTVSWIERFDLDEEQKEAGRLRSTTAGELAGRTILTAESPPGGQFSTDSLMWLFAFDDAYCDEGRYSHDPGEMAVLVAEMIRIAETGQTTSTRPLSRALADLRQRLAALTGATQVSRWEQAMKGYLGYQIWEASYRSSNRMPTIDQYAVARIRNGSMEVCTMTLDVAEGYEVPAAEMADPDVRALTEMACSLVGLDNDIASYYKEHERSGDKLNLVDVIAHERGQRPARALPEAVAFRDAVLTLYLELSEQVRPAVSAQTQRYMRGLSGWIRGNLDWSANTPRYRKHGRPTVVVADQRHGEVARFTPPPGVAWWWSRLRNVIPEPRHNQSGRLTAQVAAD